MGSVWSPQENKVGDRSALEECGNGGEVGSPGGGGEASIHRPFIPESHDHCWRTLCVLCLVGWFGKECPPGPTGSWAGGPREVK